MSDIRLVQLSRIYGKHFDTLSEATTAIADDPVCLADALFAEAADSDDVTGEESALAYLGDRLAYLDDAVGESASRLRARFGERLSAWAQ